MQFMGGAAEVDPELVQNYLPPGSATLAPVIEQADASQTQPTSEPAVQGVSTEATGAPSPPASDQKYSESQAEISYGETRWETHKDPSFGVHLDYPVNASNLVKTDTSMTVIRKTGY